MTDPIYARVVIYGWIALMVAALLKDCVKWVKQSGESIPQPSNDTPNPTQSEAKPSQIASEAQPPPAKKKPVARKPLVVHEGILLAAGFAKREYGYSSYRLEIQSDVLGISHEVWGIDLKRALEASEAKIGDRIRASLAGHVETSLGGEETSKAKKGIWDVTKIE